ncbi:MAG: hypothetical protein ACQEXJ_06735 [Myxococcota bacterium]
MSVYEVPPSDWAGFCERFTKRHRGDAMSLERVRQRDGRDVEREVLARDVPLRDLRRVHREGMDELIVRTQEAPPAGSTWVVGEPTGLRFEQHGETARGRLRITAAEEPDLVLGFTRPLVPGYLDGLPA